MALFLIMHFVGIGQSSNQDRGSDLASNEVSLRGTDYKIVTRQGRLFLASSKGTTVLKERKLYCDIPKRCRVSEIRLERWVGSGLCAILEVSGRNEFSYYCLTMSVPKSRGYDHGCARIYTSKVDHSILSLNGTIRSDSIVALLGIVGIRKGSTVIERGVVFCHDCPSPPTPGSGTLSHFTAKPK